MKIFKFGGASIKDVDGIKNLSVIVRQENDKDLCVVVSAIGKTTRALIKAQQLYIDGDINQCRSQVDAVFQFHKSIVNQLFSDNKEQTINLIDIFENELLAFINSNKSPNKSFIFDQFVQFGELLSSTIISDYLKTINVDNNWIDARSIIKTDSSHRDAKVNWDYTLKKVKEAVKIRSITLTQGYIGSDQDNYTTTLGLEGSDYSAAIMAYALNAESLTVWKDVDGILNADPRHFKDSKLLNHISFKEAIELSYYGASVIHPKTIQPLQHKEIPLFVKNFSEPTKQGTVIQKGSLMEPFMPCYIVKKNQILLSISSLDFSFIVEENMGEIFNLLSQYRIKVNLLQNSAISFTLALEDKFETFGMLLASLKSKYKLKYNYDVNLYTIRHYNDESIRDFEIGKNVLLKQINRETVQYII
jgi:aspartate kinase